MPKISALPPATSIAAPDAFPFLQSGVTKRIDFNTMQSTVANAGTVQQLIAAAVLAPVGLPVSIADGGTGQVTAANARGALDVPSALALSGSAGSTLVGFVSAGTGATSRPVQDKLRDIVSVKDFGAVGDGVTDDTAAIQAAITYASGTFGGEVGKLIYFPTGIYKLTSKLTITQSGVSWWTDGEVRFTGNDITSDYMLGVGGNSGSPIVNNRIIGNFIFFRNVANAGGGCIEWSYANYGVLSGIRTYNGLNPINVHNTTGVEINDIAFYETITGGINAYLARFDTCTSLVIKKLINAASFGSKAATKVIVDFDCDDVKISDCTVGQLLFEKTAGTFAPRWISVKGCYAESASAIAGYDFQACKSVRLDSCTGAVGLVGANFNTNSLGVCLNKCTFLDNDHDGVLIQGGSYIQIVDCDISSNNGAAGASFSGVRFTANADHVDIVRNRIKNHLDASYTHAYGILTTGGGTISDLNVEENDIANFVTLAFSDLAGATSKNSKAWAPTVSGASITVTSASYSLSGRVVFLAFDITWPVTADATAVVIAGMTDIPGMPAANSGAFVSGYTDYANVIHGVCGTTGIAFYNKGGTPNTALTNADLSGKRVIGSCVYHI